MDRERLLHVGFFAVATVAVNAALCFAALSARSDGLVAMLGLAIGASQILWIAPVHLLARRRFPNLASGVLWGGALTALRAGICYGGPIALLVYHSA